MANNNKISNIYILLTIVGMLALTGPISYAFSNDVFASQIHLMIIIPGL
jgi:hypothetical protein